MLGEQMPTRRKTTEGERLMRPTRFKLFLAAALVLSMLAGCAGGSSSQQPAPSNNAGGQSSSSSSSPSPSSEPKTLVIASGTTAVSLDPYQVTDSPSFTIMEHVYDTLFTMSATGEIQPGLAESFSADEAGTTYTIKLRPGVKFSDGSPVNAEAVKKSLEFILNPDNGARNRSMISLVSEVIAQDELTVVLKTPQPFAPLQFHLTHPGISIVAPAALDQSPEWRASNAIGSGPYVVKAYEKDVSVTLAKNPNYWGTAPILDEVVYRAVKEDGPRMLEVEAGTADVAVRVPPSDIARLQANPDLEVRTDSSLRAVYIYFNHAKPPFDKKEVRQAINYAVDKESIVNNLLQGSAIVATAPMAEAVFGYARQTPYAYNPEKAKQLLQQAGVAPGTKVTLHHPVGRYAQDAKIAEAVALQLKEVGLEVELKTLEWAQYLEETNKPSAENQIQMALLGWATSTMDADYALYNMYHSSQWADHGGYNRAFYKNEEVDRLLDLARTTVDIPARRQAYAEATKIIWDDAPWLWLHIEAQLTAVRKDVKNLEIHPAERLIWTQADKQ